MPAAQRQAMLQRMLSSEKDNSRERLRIFGFDYAIKASNFTTAADTCFISNNEVAFGESVVAHCGARAAACHCVNGVQIALCRPAA